MRETVVRPPDITGVRAHTKKLVEIADCHALTSAVVTDASNRLTQEIFKNGHSSNHFSAVIFRAVFFSISINRAATGGR